MMKRTFGALAVAGALLLSGCGASGQTQVEEGKACFDAGGTYQQAQGLADYRTVVMVCTFTQPKVAEPETTEPDEFEGDGTQPWEKADSIDLTPCQDIVDGGEWEDCANTIANGDEWKGMGA